MAKKIIGAWLTSTRVVTSADCLKFLSLYTGKVSILNFDIFALQTKVLFDGDYSEDELRPAFKAIRNSLGLIFKEYIYE